MEKSTGASLVSFSLNIRLPRLKQTTHEILRILIQATGTGFRALVTPTLASNLVATAPRKGRLR